MQAPLSKFRPLFVPVLLASVICLAFPTAGEAVPLTNGLVANWTFDDGTGKDSAGTNHATLVGSPSMVAGPSSLSMETKYTAYAVANAPELNANGWTGLTVAVWVKPVNWPYYNYGGAPGYTTYGNMFHRGTDSSGLAYFMALSTTPNYGHGLYINFSPTQLVAGVFNSFNPGSTPYPPVGNWYHLVGTYDGRFIRTYFNGVLDGSTPVPTPGLPLWEPAGSKTYIGTCASLPERNWSDQFFKGDFDEVKVWKRGLSSNEVFMLYSMGIQTYTLTVASVHGGVSPGTVTAQSSSTLIQNVTNSPITEGTTRYICTSATVVGNAFTQASPTQVSLLLTNNASLTWNWLTFYRLSVVTNGNGTVSGAGWLADGATATLMATPANGCRFAGWSGDIPGGAETNNPLSLTMASARLVTALFASDLKVLTDRASVSVPEGGVTNFQVKLNAQPAANTIVEVSRESGDADIAISVGTNLLFSTNSWDVYQAVTLSATEDNGDNLPGQAEIICRVQGLSNTVVTVTEIDDDYTLVVTMANGTVVKKPNQPLYDSGTSVSLEAFPDAGYHFTLWSGNADGTNNPVSVIMGGNMTIAAAFVTNLPAGTNETLTKGLVANWTFDDGTGDDSAGANHATLVGSPSMVAGQFGLSMETKYTAYAVANAPELNANGWTGLTVAIWVKPVNWPYYNYGGAPGYTTYGNMLHRGTDSSGLAYFMALSTTPNYGHGLYINFSPTQQVAGVFNSFNPGATPYPPVGNWYHLVGTYDGRFIRTYVNGVLDGSTPVPTPGLPLWEPAGSKTYIGTCAQFPERNWQDQFFKGDFDDVKVWKRGLSALEVFHLYNQDARLSILTTPSPFGVVVRNPNRPDYADGTEVSLTAVPDPAYYFKGWTGDLVDTNNPTIVRMDGDKSVTAIYGPTAPGILPPKAIGRKTFTARWKWVEGGAPEGELSVILEVGGFPQYVPEYRSRYVGNETECVVSNLITGKDYWYRIRRLMPDGSVGPWSSQMKVRTGRAVPVFRHLLSDDPVSKGLSQEFALSDLVSGGGTVKVKSSNENAVKAGLTAEALTLQYLWKDSNAAADVTLTLSHPETGYKVAYTATLSRAQGPVAIVGVSELINTGNAMVQDVTAENRTKATMHGIRIRVTGLDQDSWLLNQTGLDPVSKAPVIEKPCLLPAGQQVTVRMRYHPAYMKQARTRAVTYGAWAIMTPMTDSLPAYREMAIAQQNSYDGLWLLNMEASRNRLYSVYHSDDDGATWTMNVPLIRATATYLMWLDMDEEAPGNRLYRIVDAGI